jgi:signal transduction histidine kinase/ligand-binding sensor domain-containing protein
MTPGSKVLLLCAAIHWTFCVQDWVWAAEISSPALPAPAPEALDRFTFKRWNTEQGLPQSNVRAITQTRDGYLWVGTLNGLARFDGVRFEVFRAGNTPELFSDTINVLHEDRAGVLWIGTVDGGLARYHQGNFQLFSNADGLRSITINAVAEDGDGVLWVGTAGGLHRMVASNRLERIAQAVVPTEVIAGLRANHDGDLWVITLQAIRRLRHGQLVSPVIKSPKVIRSFGIHRSGDLWVGFESGEMGRAAAGSGTLQREKGTPHATTLHQDRNGVLWMGTSNGELWQAAESGAWAKVAQPAGATILAARDDAQGNLWLGFEGVGLGRLREKILTTHTTEHGPLETHLTSLAEDPEGRIWAGTMGRGLFVWDEEENQFLPVPIAPAAMNVTSLLWDRQGALLCGTLHVHHGRLYRRDAQAERFAIQPGFGRQCRVLFEDREGGIWAGKWRGGLEHYVDRTVTRYVPTNGLSNDRIFSIAQDAQGDIWIGTLHGLNRLSKTNGNITRYYREDGLGGNDIRVLSVDHEGTLWAGSTGGGLTRYQNGRFAVLTTKQGLTSDWVEQILEDDQGQLWLGSSAGLMRASLRDLNACASGQIPYVDCLALRQEEGLLLPHTGTGFQRSCLKTRRGELWFGTEAGVVVIDPKRIQPNPNPPAVFIEKLSIDQEEHGVYPKSPTTVTVAPGRQRLAFHYTGLDLSAPAAVRFRYKLEGYDRDWLNAGLKREAVYTRVPPGQYHFRVLAANNDGAWNTEGAGLGVIVLPSWWETWWFQTALVVGLLGTAFGAYEFRLRQLQKARALQHAFSRQLIASQEQERKRVAAELHDSLGQSLQIIKGRAQLGLAGGRRADEQAKQFEEISEAAGQAIREVRAISHALRPVELDQLGLTKAVEWMVHQAGATSATLFACESQNIDGLLPPEIEISLYRIAQEGLNNVLRHAGAREAILELKREGDTVRFSLFDDGCGFAKSTPAGAGAGQTRFGQGLAGIAERVKLFGGEFDLQSTPGRGTRLTVRCKLSQRK